MQRQVTALLLIFFRRSTLISEVGGECGFPGTPLSGFVDVALEEVHRRPPHVHDSSNGNNNWRMYPSGANITFNCLDTFWIVGLRHRTCRKDGAWTNGVPQCAVKVGTFCCQAVQCQNSTCCHLAEKEINDTCSVNVRKNFSLRLQLEAPRRIAGIRFFVNSNFIDLAAGLANANWSLSLASSNETSVAEKVTIMSQFHRDGHSSVIVGAAPRRHRDVMVVTQTADSTFDLTSVEVFAFQDDCGHPEVPAHSRVEWIGAGTVQYTCDDGYEDDSRSLVRNCTDGAWQGRQPICEKKRVGLSFVISGVLIMAALLIGSTITLWQVVKKRKALSPTEIALDTELSSVGKTTPASSYSRLQSTL